MFITSRARRVNPAAQRAAVAFAVEAGARARQMLDRPIWTWMSVMSEDAGVVSWSTRTDHLQDTIDIDDTLFGDDDFADWVEANDGHFTGPFVDRVAEVISGTPSSEPGAYVQVASGVCANGAIAEGLSFGVEIAEVASRLSGLPTMFAAPVVGAYGSVMWATSIPDLAALEAGDAKLRESDEWIKLVDRAGHAFQPGVRSFLLRRLD